MSLRKFGNKDVFVNTMRTYPNCDFVIFDSKVIYNNVPPQSGSRNDLVRNVSSSKGFISLYEYNIDRPYINTGEYVQTSSIPNTGIIYPWISKDSARSSFKTVNEVDYNNEFEYGAILTSSYPLSASITREYIETPFASTTSYNTRYVALRNRLNYYSTLSQHYKVSSSFGNKDTQKLNMVSVPSIFYGSRIKPGTLSLKWYFTGSLIGELRDIRENGELIQVGPEGSPGLGSVAGVALYEEGVLVLTGSWELNNQTIAMKWDPSGTDINHKPKWLYFAAGANDDISKNRDDILWPNNTFVSSSFDLSFKGHSDTQVLTMYAHAGRGQANYSNNPTFLKYGQTKVAFTSSHVYEESGEVLLKNFVSSSHSHYSSSFQRQVFISRIAIYDNNKNLIGIATLGQPVLKKEADKISFKIKLDI